jgi:tRNA A-37 threonylcarbamoyl transferase component Bud32
MTASIMNAKPLHRNPAFSDPAPVAWLCVTINRATRILPAVRMSNDTQSTVSSPSTLVRRRLGRFHWVTSGPFEQAPWLNRLEHPETLLKPPAEPLKQSLPGREVVRVRLGQSAGAEVVVKHSTPRGLAEAIKWSWRGSTAVRAFELAQRLRAQGLVTAPPVAAGERRTAGLLRESYLLTEFIGDATPLHLVNAHCADRQRRIGIVRSLARLYAAMHDTGFYHCDPSQANFLVVSQPDGRDAVALVDLDGLRQRREINARAAAGDLRRFLVRGRVPRRERAWFMVVYSRSRRIRVQVRQLVKLIGPLPTGATFPHCALNEESLPVTTDPGAPGDFRESSAPPEGETHSLPRGGLVWQVRRPLLTGTVEAILTAPDEFLKRAKVLKPSRSSAVSAQDGLVLKRYNLRKWRNLFKDLFRGSKARRCFFRALHLELAGIPTARVLAFAEQRCCGIPTRSYLLMEEIPQATSLFGWQGDKQQALQSLARLLARLHDAGFTHRDLKEGNILLNGAGEPFLVDLDGVRYVRKVEHAWAAADLARLAASASAERRVTRTDFARFLDAYGRMRRHGDWRFWWREIARCQARA